MDLVKILGELYAERQQLIKIIDSLESLHGKKPAKAPVKRRGRKYMDATARKEVSLRMKRYWAERREQQEQQNKTNTAGDSAAEE